MSAMRNSLIFGTSDSHNAKRGFYLGLLGHGNGYKNIVMLRL